MFFDKGYIWKTLPDKGTCLCRTGVGGDANAVPKHTLEEDDDAARIAQTVPDGACRQVVLAATRVVIDDTLAPRPMQLEAGRLLLERVFTAAPTCNTTATDRKHATHALQWLLQQGLLVDDGVSPPVVADYLFQDLDSYSSDILGIITTMVCRSALNRPIPGGRHDADTLLTRMDNSASVHLRDLATTLCTKFSCVRDSGYTGDGTSSTDVDECVSGSVNGDASCGGGAINSYTYTCDDGFDGNTFGLSSYYSSSKVL
jgi:hypothetical protein